MSEPRSRRIQRLLRNPLSLLGLGVAVIATAIGLPMLLIDVVQPHHSPYVAVLIYLMLPGVAIGGVAVALLGLVWERARRRKRPDQPIPLLPQIDLNRPAHQAAVLGSLFGLLVVLVLLSVTGYRAYHFTESVKFCGLVCHQVMKPEYTAYQYSPHARVACVQCHVGSRAEWFVRSKLNGLHQVYSVATTTYPRPIPTPVRNLRPAPETCEQCHWPAKFFGAQQKTITRYLADEQNSPWQIQLLLKIGGGDPKTGAAAGIHWHMNIKNDIDYIAADERRDVIPWVRVTDPEGRVTEYQSTEEPLSPDRLAASKI
ncbi:MAG: NapC/NirT family cytochrome c, partial [Gemmatimonadetes bacterium]|nr:NapC/NirT family cytochrome c [Gemmatimonadota bacterium]